MIHTGDTWRFFHHVRIRAEEIWSGMRNWRRFDWQHSCDRQPLFAYMFHFRTAEYMWWRRRRHRRRTEQVLHWFSDKLSNDCDQQRIAVIVIPAESIESIDLNLAVSSVCCQLMRANTYLPSKILSENLPPSPSSSSSSSSSGYYRWMGEGGALIDFHCQFFAVGTVSQYFNDFKRSMLSWIDFDFDFLRFFQRCQIHRAICMRCSSSNICGLLVNWLEERKRAKK